MLNFQQFLLETVGYTAYIFDDHTRKELLHKFPAENPDVVCHHVTYKMPAKQAEALPPEAHEAHVVGIAEDDGIQALVVSVNGSTHRPDGGTFHITLSIDRKKGKKPFHSNALLKNGYKHVQPFAIKLTPAFLNL